MNTIRYHWAALVLALVVGVVTAAPFVIFETSSGYQGISMMGTDAESHYLARMQEVYDGFPLQGNVFLSNKNIPPIEPGLGEFIEVNLGQTLHVSVSVVETYGKFFFPLIIALLLYALVYTLSVSRAASVLAVVFVMFGDYFMSNPRALLGFLNGTVPYTGFLTYARPISPEISAIFLFATLLLIARLFFRKSTIFHNRRNIALVAVSILTGLSLYVSIYTFIFLGTFELVFFLYLFFSHKYREAIEVGVVGFLALLFTVPFIVNYLSLITYPAYRDASERFGLVLSHSPVLGILVLSIIVIAWLLPQSIRNIRTFFLLSATALILVLNQQILTGYVLQTEHFHWYITKPLIGAASAIFLVVLTKRLVYLRWVRIGIYGALCGVLLYGAVLIQNTSYRSAYPVAHAAQRYVSILAYLSTFPKTSMVWSDRKLSTYVPIYTHDNAPNNNYLMYYLVPQKYLIKRMLLEYRLRNISPDKIQEVMYHDRIDISSRLFGVYWRDSAGGYASIPNVFLKTYAQEYTKIYTQPLGTLFKELGVTDVVWDTKTQLEWNLNSRLSEKPVKINPFWVYHLIATKKS